MCGIAGVAAPGRSLPDAKILDRFKAALAHRGPDGSGQFVGPGFAIMQTRLAIIDLVSGDQPLFGPQDTVLVANGEIYNFVELRPEFRGANFATNSDCETPLHTYQRDGADFAKSLRGMYAIALCDPAVDSVYLARDPFGIKPLYYAQTDVGLLFASELQAIRKAGPFATHVRPEAANELLQLQFNTGRETIFKGINRVLPGETLTVRGGKIASHQRLPAVEFDKRERLDERQALTRLDDALMDSVRVHQRSDVPYGMFLSGGIDSSALLACMAKLNDRPVLAYTAGFPGAGVADERAHASEVAKALGAHHVEVAVTADQFWARLPEVVACMDDPAADYAIIPTYFLAERAAQDVKVILCGEGGDELLGGYSRYRSAMRPRWLGGRPMRAKGFFHGLDVLRTTGGWRNGFAHVEQELAAMPGSVLQRSQALDMADWLPNDLLTKLDRCLMAHALEGRTPFLDPVVAAATFNLADELKISKGLGKHILRRWLDQRLPMARAFEAKRGFSVPVGEWIAPKAAGLAELVSRAEGIVQVCDPARVAALFRAASSGAKRELAACWQLLFYALWHRVHVEGISPRGNVFDVLGAR